MLKEGTKLNSLWWPNGPAIICGPNFEPLIKSIVVTMEAGQNAEVPWARVEQEDGEVQLHNLAFVEGVEVAEEEPDAEALTIGNRVLVDKTQVHLRIGDWENWVHIACDPGGPYSASILPTTYDLDKVTCDNCRAAEPDKEDPPCTAENS